MKSISIRQPWAELVVRGLKTMELRAWKTSHRGRIFVHAGYVVDEPACRLCGLDPDAVAHGALVGTVEVTDVVRLDHIQFEALRAEHRSSGGWPGGELFGWRLKDPQRLPVPLPMRGQPGLYELPEGAVEGCSSASPVNTDASLTAEQREPGPRLTLKTGQ